MSFLITLTLVLQASHAIAISVLKQPLYGEMHGSNVGWEKLSTGRIISFDAKECNRIEYKHIEHVENIIHRIKGMVSLNTTLYPQDPPAVCKQQTIPTAATVSNCYAAWGFGPNHVPCLATEAMSVVSTCKTVCSNNEKLTAKNMKCQTCLANLRKQRRVCLYDNMGISVKCRACNLNAFKYWDDNCMLDCVDNFNPEKKAPTNAACRKCTDDLYHKLADCGTSLNS